MPSRNSIIPQVMRPSRGHPSAPDNNLGRDTSTRTANSTTDKVSAGPQVSKTEGGDDETLSSSSIIDTYTSTLNNHPVSPNSHAASTPATAPFLPRAEKLSEQGVYRLPSCSNPYPGTTQSSAPAPPADNRRAVSPQHQGSTTLDSGASGTMDDKRNIGNRKLLQPHAQEYNCSRTADCTAGTDAHLLHNKANIDHASRSLNYNAASGQELTHSHTLAQFEPDSLRGRLDPSSTKANIEKEDIHDSTTDTPKDRSVSRTRRSGSQRRPPQDPHKHLRNDMVEKQDVNQHSSLSRKTGVPGRNGEEPETDLFNFVGIMLDMPKQPTWRIVISKLAKALFVMTLSYFGLMALYFGAEFQADSQMKNFDIMVVNLDQGMIGMHFDNYTQSLNKLPGQPNWSLQSSTVYPTISAIQEQVRNGRFWGAVVVQTNASTNLNQAFATQFRKYDPARAFAFIYDSGRDPLVVKPRIVSAMYLQFLQFSKLFNPVWVQFVLNYSESQTSFNVSSLARSPQVLGTPIAFEEFDLHPITASIITSATSVAYIWIFLVAGGSTYLVAHIIQPMTRGASVGKTMAFLLTPLFLFVVVLSMTYSILLLAFGVPFPNGASQFLSLFAGMLLLQCAVASMVLFLIYLIPVVFIPSITITFVILNVIAVFNPVELMPTFYRWVYAMPFLNAVQISRYALMGSYNRLKYNVSILAIWTLIPLMLLPLAIVRQKRMVQELEAIKELEEEEEERRKAEKTTLQQKDLEFHRRPSRKERHGRPSREDIEREDTLRGKSDESDYEDGVVRLGGEQYRLDTYPDGEGKPRSSRRGDRRAYARQEQPRVAKASSQTQHMPTQLKALGNRSGASPSAPSESRVFGRASAPRSRPYERRRQDEIAANMIPNEVKE